MTEYFTVTAKTSDGVELNATAATYMELVADESLLLEMARKHPDVELTLRTELRKFLTDQLTAIIEKSTMQELQDQFFDDRQWLTSDNGEASTMPSGTLWSGNSMVTELKLTLN